MTIFRDAQGYIVDSTGDGGDSAEREGMWQLCNGGGTNILAYVDLKSRGTRHPYQVPWNNPLNFSRDQIIAIFAGFYHFGEFPTPKELFYRQLKGFGFAQNWQRDVVGSWKYPWPSKIPDPQALGNPNATKWVWFDCADIYSPADWWHMAKCAKSLLQYPLAIVGAPWLVLELFAHSHLSDPMAEDNQTIAKSIVAGKWAVKLFKWFKPNWQASLQAYWDSRQMPEFYAMIANKLEG